MKAPHLLLALLLATAAPASAQDAEFASELNSEIIVTGSRRVSLEDRDDSPPLIGLRRTADFAVQAVAVVGDTRDAAKRSEEIFAMIRGAIALAAKQGGIELATGASFVEPLTLQNYQSLTLGGDGRPDTNRASFLIKTPLVAGANAKAALDRINAFIKAVPTVGRAELRRQGDLTLSVVRPGQYRAAILDLVAADARATAARLGPDYAASVSGLDRAVEWTRASLTDVFLYVPYGYAVVPKD